MIVDPNKFSILKRLVHVTGWVQRFLTNCTLLMNLGRKDQIFLLTEISTAETFWIKQAQAQAFPGEENEGSGVEQVLTELRSRFWIEKGRRLVRSGTEACAECRRCFTKKLMASLPKSRLQSSLRAFEILGSDCGGPLLTKQEVGQELSVTYVFSLALEPKLCIFPTHWTLTLLLTHLPG